MTKNQETIENILLSIWQEQLSIPQIASTDSFIKLGGDSLIAMKIIARVEKYLNIRLKISLIFSLKNIKNLANYIASKQNNVTADTPVLLSGETTAIDNHEAWLATKHTQQTYLEPHIVHIAKLPLLPELFIYNQATS